MKIDLRDKDPFDYLREQDEAEGPPDEWDEEPYFEDDNDKCPPLGMQGGVVHTRRKVG